jgi:glycosyltransferase involved in cell wall biosynthesis
MSQGTATSRVRGVESSTGRANAASRNPRIAIVAPSLDILGGQGIQARDLADALEQEGFDVLFLPVNPRFPKGLRWLRRVPIARTLLNQVLYAFTLPRLRHADVVHVFSASYWSFLLAPVPAILAAKGLGKRVILNYHSGEADDHLGHWGARVHPFLRRVDEIVVPSVYLRQVFEDHGYPAKVVRNIIDLSTFQFHERRPLRPRLLSCRNLESHYRVEDVLAAFALIKKTLPDATLQVAGYGSEAARLQQQARDLGLEDIDFLGRVEPEDIPALYERTDIFLNASVVDNQPISILEAFAAGLAVVTTPTGDIPWMLDDERLGVLVPHEKPEAMARAVLELIETPDQASQMTRRAQEAVGRYTWEQVQPEWLEVYGAPGAAAGREQQRQKQQERGDETQATA